jgi:amidase
MFYPNLHCHHTENITQGGSLRIPAACTGIFTLRPSAGRFPTQRCRSGLAGQEAVQSVNGPMGKTLEDIILYSKAIIDAQPWKVDPKMVPIPWRSVEPPKKLKIAVLWNDGICTPTPPVTRALEQTLEKLKSAGHGVVEWDPKLHSTALELLVRLCRCCAGPGLTDQGTHVCRRWR